MAKPATQNSGNQRYFPTFFSKSRFSAAQTIERNDPRWPVTCVLQSPVSETSSGGPSVNGEVRAMRKKGTDLWFQAVIAKVS